MASVAGPSHELKLIKELILLGCYQVTGRAASDAGEMGFDESDILECVDALTLDDFDKTMESETFPGSWQDVYKRECSGIQTYIKLQVVKPYKPDATTIVISFHRCRE
jgi:hypothetical protein